MDQLMTLVLEDKDVALILITLQSSRNYWQMIDESVVTGDQERQSAREHLAKYDRIITAITSQIGGKP